MEPLHLVVTHFLIPVDQEGPEGFIVRVAGDVEIFDEADEKQTIGRFSLFQVDIDAAALSGWGAAFLLDTTEETSHYMALFKSRGSSFTRAVENRCESALMGSNMLILNRLELLKAHRGLGYGPRIIKALIRQFAPYGGVGGIVAIRPFPLQFERVDMDPPETSPEAWYEALDFKSLHGDERMATKCLKDLYAASGFVEVRGTGLMVLDPTLA